ncbi:NAD(P)H-flavin reductase [Alteromonadaceae bacterium M269]|nr:NAD(P)H-flavin reductase [Alteromonadaceae bacterium M269]
MSETRCKITKIENLTTSVKRVVLTPEEPMSFLAGQYIQVVMGENDRRPFSIANAQKADGTIELHIGAMPGNSYALEVLEQFEKGTAVIEGPLGQASLKQNTDSPIILLAGGTGYSYTRSILQKLLEQPLENPVYLYWGARQLPELYEHQELLALESQHPKFHFVPVVQEPESNWTGKTGLVHQAVMGDFEDLSPFSVYVAGRFEMAAVVREDFSKQGLKTESLFGDAYAFI